LGKRPRDRVGKKKWADDDKKEGGQGGRVKHHLNNSESSEPIITLHKWGGLKKKTKMKGGERNCVPLGALGSHKEWDAARNWGRCMRNLGEKEGPKGGEFQESKNSIKGEGVKNCSKKRRQTRGEKRERETMY